MSKSPKYSGGSPVRLPQRSETWLLSVRKLSIWYEMEDGFPAHPYLILIVDPVREEILESELEHEYPGVEAVKGLVWRAMLKPRRELRQPPHRPREILSDFQSGWDELAAALEELEVSLRYVAELEGIAELIMELEEALGGEAERPGLLSLAENTLELVGDLFSAAAEAFRAGPWIYLNTEQPVKYSIPALDRHGYTQLMGHSAIEYGLLLFEAWEDIQRIYLNVSDPRLAIPEKGLLSLSYVTPSLMSPDDLAAVRANGWPIASEEAYPLPLVMYADRVERPDSGSLQAINTLLRALPEFTERLEPDLRGDYLPLKMDIEVYTYAGPLEIRLEYPAGELQRETFPVTISLADDDRVENFNEIESLDSDEVMDGEPSPNEDESLVDWQASEIALRKPELVQAMALIYQAWDEDDPQQRIQLARQALEVTPDCAEAYLLLGDELAVNIGQALKYYEKGVAAGERTLGEAYFQKYSGEFWQRVEARPYLRALANLAHTQWELGKLDQALGNMHQLLHLDSGDTLEVRYGLRALLLESGQWTEAFELSNSFTDLSTDWTYTRALLAYHETGDSQQASAILTDALRINPHVPDYLSGRLRLPAQLPEITLPGQKSEAVLYASTSIAYWRQVRGAVDWLRKTARASQANRNNSKKPSRSKYRR